MLACSPNLSREFPFTKVSREATKNRSKTRAILHGTPRQSLGLLECDARLFGGSGVNALVRNPDDLSSALSTARGALIDGPASLGNAFGHLQIESNQVGAPR